MRSSGSWALLPTRFRDARGSSRITFAVLVVLGVGVFVFVYAVLGMVIDLIGGLA